MIHKVTKIRIIVNLIWEVIKILNNVEILTNELNYMTYKSNHVWLQIYTVLLVVEMQQCRECVAVNNPEYTL